MSERRVTPEEVKAAYEATGAEPRRRTWVTPKRGMSVVENCGDAQACGLGVMFLKERQPSKISEDTWNAASYYAKSEFGEDYVQGFVSGFDNPGHVPGHKGRECQGFCDGKAAAELMFNPKPKEADDVKAS